MPSNAQSTLQAANAAGSSSDWPMAYRHSPVCSIPLKSTLRTLRCLETPHLCGIGSGTWSAIMISITDFGRNAQRIACAIIAACIVFACLSLGAYEAKAVAHPGYSITITQLR